MYKVNSNNAGKGSKPRPISISKEQYKKNWNKIVTGKHSKFKRWWFS